MEATEHEVSTRLLSHGPVHRKAPRTSRREGQTERLREKGGGGSGEQYNVTGKELLLRKV